MSCKCSFFISLKSNFSFNLFRSVTNEKMTQIIQNFYYFSAAGKTFHGHFKYWTFPWLCLSLNICLQQFVAFSHSDWILIPFHCLESGLAIKFWKNLLTSSGISVSPLIILDSFESLDNRIFVDLKTSLRSVRASLTSAFLITSSKYLDAEYAIFPFLDFPLDFNISLPLYILIISSSFFELEVTSMNSSSPSFVSRCW